jgi:hypothetical protein
MLKSFLRLVFLIICCFPKFNFGQSYLKIDLLEDLHYMDSAYRFGHPMNEIKSIPLNFSNSIDRVTNPLPDTLNKIQYENAVREVLMDVRCSHTNVDQWNKLTPKRLIPTKFFPFHVFTDGARIWITGKVNDSIQSALEKGFEIISINGNKMDSVLPILKNYHPQDGNGNELSIHIINEMFPSLYAKCFDRDSIFNVVYIDHKGEFQKSIEKGRGFEKRIETDKVADVQGNQAYLSLINDTIGYLRIKEIQSKEQEFYDSVFQRIDDRKIHYLIIDLRNNTGGSLFSSADLISYLTPDTCSFSITLPQKNLRPFLSWKYRRKSRWTTFRWKIVKKFDHEKTADGTIFKSYMYPKERLGYKGELFILTNGYTASGASFITSYARHYSKAIVIGQKTGGGEFWNSAGTYPPIILPKSGLKIQSATTHMKTDFKAKHFDGITPDYQIHYDAETYGVRDLEMEAVFELIGN